MCKLKWWPYTGGKLSFDCKIKCRPSYLPSTHAHSSADNTQLYMTLLKDRLKCYAGCSGWGGWSPFFLPSLPESPWKYFLLFWEAKSFFSCSLQVHGNTMDRCVFSEDSFDGYTTFRSMYNTSWYLGFKRNGKVKQPHNTTNVQKAARFIPYKS